MHPLKYNHIKPGVDIVADRHGYFDEEVALFHAMDYRLIKGVFTHKTGARSLYLLGDAPDRGDKIVDVNTVEKATIETGNARAIIGNHEYNHICMNIRHPAKPGEYLRPRNAQNKGQTHQTHKQYKAVGDDKALWRNHMAFYQTLPIYDQNDEFRVVHACWDPKNIAVLDQHLKNGVLTTDDIIHAETNWRKSELSKAIVETLKGKEIKTELLLDVGFTKADLENQQSTKRIAWWYENRGDMIVPAGDVILDLPKQLRDKKIPLALVADQLVDDPDPRPVFFGHYCLRNPPVITSAKAQCLDFGVIKTKGCLTAYRWNFGDKGLNAEQLISVPRVTPALAV